MTEQDKITIFDSLNKPFLCSDASMDGQEGNNLFAIAIRRLLNSSLLAQQDEHLGCERYERMSTRNGQRNGFKSRTIRTSTGQIRLDVPQVRNSQTPFTPIIPGFERVSRIDRALNLAIAEMYLQGVSAALSEASEHWATFIQSLMMRGMNRPNSITSDDHKSIRKTLAETLTGVPWQRCQFHFQQNAQAYVTSVRYRSVASPLSIFETCLTLGIGHLQG